MRVKGGSFFSVAPSWLAIVTPLKYHHKIHQSNCLFAQVPRLASLERFVISNLNKWFLIIQSTWIVNVCLSFENFVSLEKSNVEPIERLTRQRQGGSWSTWISHVFLISLTSRELVVSPQAASHWSDTHFCDFPCQDDFCPTNKDVAN